MSEAVLDSSVILAVLKDERLDEEALEWIDGGVMSAVNVAEVYSKLSELKMTALPRVEALLRTLDRIEPFTQEQARAAGLLRERTMQAGLSLGDRACLALAISLGAEVYTVDRAWARVDAGCSIHLLRA